MAAAQLAQAVAQVTADFSYTLKQLKDLIRIPSCSFAGFDPAYVVASANATAAWLRAAGYPEVRVVELAPDADGKPVLPYVIARDHRAGQGQPTVLLYAHHDIQPPLREHLWQSPPHEPTERDGRLYARGAADDKAGIAAHCAAAAAWNAVAGHPPVNLTVLIEGEEEIGSPNFSRFLAAHAAELQADCVVIADLANVDTGLPSLTTSLRGHVALEVELKALKSPLHSGMWGGPVPDVVMALCRLLATCTDAAGRITIPGLVDRVRPLSAAERAGFARIPFMAERFAAQAGLLRPEAIPGIADPVAVHAALWREPTLAINAIQAGERGRTGNVLMDAAWARLGIRIVPDLDGETVLRQLTAHLQAHCPPWAELTISDARAGEAWATATAHPAFAAAREALRLGYGVAPIEIGCGASIPFVGEITARLGGIPALLIGVEDPACAAHAENESVHLGDLRSAIAAEAALFGLLVR
jgi:cysteinylglycine-S-conjugate dipeptidase